MVDAIDGHAVQHHEVLLGPAAPHVQAGEALHAALDAGQQLEALQDVRFSEQGGGGLDLAERHFQRAGIDGLQAGVFAGDDAGCFQLGIAGQGEIEGRIPLQIKLQLQWVESEVGDLQGVRSGGQRQRIEPELVGHGTGLSGQNTRADQGLARGGVGDVPADGHAAHADGFGSRRDGAENDAAAAFFPTQSSVAETLAQGFFEGQAGRQRLQLPGLLQGAAEGGIVDETDIVFFAELLHPQEQRVLGGRGKDRTQEQEEDQFEFHSASI